MGHLSIQTTQGYTHMNPVHERAPLEQLSQELPLHALMSAPRLDGGGKSGGKSRQKTSTKKAKAASRKPRRSHRQKLAS